MKQLLIKVREVAATASSPSVLIQLMLFLEKVFLSCLLSTLQVCSGKSCTCLN